MSAAMLLPLLDRMTALVLGWVAPALALGTLLAVVTALLLRTVGRNWPTLLHAGLWLIVLVKFLVPHGPSWPVSIPGLASRLATTLRTPPVAAIASSDDKGRDVSTVRLIEIPEEPAAAGGVGVRPRNLIGLAYLACAVGVALVRIRAYRRFAAASRALPRAADSIQALAAACCRRLNLPRVPDVRCGDEAPAPYIFGVRRPVLVVPRDSLDRSEELEAIMLHEVAHLRRGDWLVRYVQWIAGTLFFFWPVVAWVNRRLDLAREIACDQWALRHARLSAGAYARCLLRAIRPGRASAALYRPAAMAANVKNVERRIDMILNSPAHRARPWLVASALLLVPAWSVFALAGATADPADGQPAAKPAQSQEGQVVIEANAESEGEEPCKVFVRSLGNGELPPEAHMIRLHMPSRKELAAFLADHPTADADNNGRLNKLEYDAFLAARAMSNPAAVVERFGQQADRNGDGILSDEEAALFVSGGIWFREEAEPVANNADEKTRERRVDFMRFVHRRRDGKPGPEVADLPNPKAVSQWLLENIQVEPTAADVARYVSVVDQAPFADVLRKHPEADTNGDGRLSPQERDAFFRIHEHRPDVGAILAKEFPELDLNHDGVLDHDEMKGLKDKGRFVRKIESGDGSDREEVRVEGGGDQVKVIVVKEATQKDESPKDNE